MRLSTINFKAKDFLDTKLKDGYGDFGGIPYDGYTLDEYLHDIAKDDNDYEELKETDIYDINTILVIESGIQAIDYNYEEERAMLACMAAFYVKEFNPDAWDTMLLFRKCLDWANSHDLEMENDDGLFPYLINTEVTREEAIEFAKSLKYEDYH